MADGRVVIDSYLDPSGAEKGIQDLQRSMESAGKKIGNVGKTLTKTVTTPILGIASAAVWTGAGFEEQMSKVQAISGATGDELQALEDVAREMGATTRFSASESAEALEYMALSGWNAQEMIDGLPGVLNLAAAGSLELGQASDIVTDMMSVFGMEADRATEASDIFAYAQANANTNVEQLGEALAKSGPSAAAAGMDLSQTSAILSIFANNGVKGSRAGTILESMLRDVRESAEDGAIAIGDTSVAVYDAEGNMRSLADIMADVESATEGMTGQQRDAALAAIFQQQSMRGANLILGEGTDALYEMEEGLYASEGAAADAAETMEDNLMGALREMKSTFEDLMLDVFEVLGPHLRNLVDWITDLARSFGELDDQTKIIIMAIAAVAAAIGPLLIAIGLVVKTVGMLAPVFAALFSPIGLIIGAIAALAAGFIYLWNTNEGFRDFILEAWENIRARGEEIWNSVSEVLQSAWETIKEVVSTVLEEVVSFIQERLEMIREFWSENGEAILQAAQNVFRFIYNLISSIMNGIWAVMEFIWPAIRYLIVTTWELIKGVIDGALNFIMGLVNTFVGLFTGDFSRMWEGIKQMFTGAVQFLWNAIQLYFIGRIIGVARSFVGMFRNLISNMWTNIRNLFTNSLNAVRNTVQNVTNGIRNIWQNVWNAIFNFIRNIFTNIRNTVTSSFNAVRSTITNVINAIRNVITTVLNAIRNTFSNIFSSVRSVVSTAINGVRNIIRSGIEGALNIVTNMGRRFLQAGRNIVQSIADGIRNGIGAVTGAISNVASSIRDALPFSPAKWGPLADLDKLDFGGPITDSIEGDIRGVQKSMANLLSVPSLNISANLASTGAGNQSTTNDNRTVNITVDAGNIDELQRVIEIFTGLRQTVRKG